MKSEQEIVREFFDNPEQATPDMQALLDSRPAPKYADTDAMIAEQTNNAFARPRSPARAGSDKSAKSHVRHNVP
jgi:hypothetical protein